MAIGVMWKTVSEACNLACDYCYYSHCGGQPNEILRIEPRVLESFIRDYMNLSDGSASFAWQGGEPLLAGLPFFEEVVALQAQYAPPGTSIGNAVQTNGTLITEEWALFFKQYNFLVGVSIDGPKSIHDARRVTHSGAGSFERVMRGVAHLNRYKVEYNVLTVIHPGNVRRVRELMDFYRDNDFRWVQFIPSMAFSAQAVQQSGSYEITPDEYGDFLCEAFEYWYDEEYPRFSIRMFDSVLSLYMNRDPGFCVLSKTCGQTLVLEQNGDAYPCDFFMDADWRLGNVGEQSIAELLASPAMRRFATLKPTLPESCQSCQWKSVCHGGCPRNRVYGEGGEVAPDYFCAAYQRFYSYAEERMQRLALRLRKRLFEEQSGRVRDVGRNDLCPCGSGHKYKRCCQPLKEMDWRMD